MRTKKQAKTISVNRLQIVVSFFCTSLFYISGNAQNDLDRKKRYLFFDKITGLENSELHNGIVYEEVHRVKNKNTKFFPEPDFVLGSVVFNGQPYFDVSIKYNVYDDELLMLVEKQFGGNTLQLYKTKVDSFKIGDYLFKKIKNPSLQNGFYEVVFETHKFSLLKKHQKNLRQQLGEKQVYYEFETEPGRNFLLRSNSYHEVKNAGDIISLFPEHKDALESFYEKEESGSTLKSLLEYLDGLISEKDKKKDN